MKSLKKIAAVVATLALTVGMTANCFAASWQSYFGVNEAWFEGAEGKLSSQSATGWTADMKTIGWGGCWGAQVKQPVKVKKGEEYTIKYTLSSSKCDKWVFVKIADKKENFAYGKWVKIKKGKSRLQQIQIHLHLVSVVNLVIERVLIKMQQRDIHMHQVELLH